MPYLNTAGPFAANNPGCNEAKQFMIFQTKGNRKNKDFQFCKTIFGPIRI